MKTWDELTVEQQDKAIEKILADDLEALVAGAIRFSDELNGDNLQETIDNAIQEAEDMQTPWFAHEYIWEARYYLGKGHIVEDDGLWPVSEFLHSIAGPVVEDAMYPEKNEVVISGIL